RTVLMSRIEAMSESGIKGELIGPPRCGLFGDDTRESFVALEEFLQMRRCLSDFFGVGFAAVTLALFILLSCVPAVPRIAAIAGPQGPEEGVFRRQPWLLPSAQPGVLMRATLFRPSGAGPFPLAVINHGTTQNAERRRALPMPSFETLSH